MTRSIFPAALAGAFACLLLPCAPAWAQLGSGWTEYNPVRRLQVRGCGSHSEGAEAETFGVTCTDNSGDNRAEQRIENDYTSGTRQFEGEVRVVSLPGTNISLKQTFMPENGAFLMIGVSNDGRLYSVGDGGSGNLASGVIGQWVRINTVHSVSAGTHQIFIDGALKFTKTGGRQVPWHDKYGSYRLGSGRGPIVVEWRKVRFWRDGNASGMVGSPPADGGASDGGASLPPDASIPADTGGGAGGAGSGGESGGASGAGGRGGGAGTAGASAPGPVGGEEPAGCGCTLGGLQGGAGGAGLVAPLLLVIGYRSRVRRRSA